MLGIQKVAHASSTALLERRSGYRFPLPLSCRLYPVSSEKSEFAGTVINISRSGILIALDSPVASGALGAGEAVRVVVDLPRNPLFAPRCLDCLATVVRVGVPMTQTQVAVAIKRIRVSDQDVKGNSTRDWLSAPIQGPIQ